VSSRRRNGGQQTHGVVSTPGSALEIIVADRDEWKRRALANEEKYERAKREAAVLDLVRKAERENTVPFVEELVDLRALRDEVLDVCAAAKPVLCSTCNGSGHVQVVRRDENGAYLGVYWPECTACAGVGWTVP
jgi:DnaJ-class molecular chaperone